VTGPERKKKPRLSIAARLLVKLVELNVFPRDHVAEQLIIPLQMLDQYCSGELAIPLDRQMALANLLAERVPALSREGRRLRGQVEAAIAYESGQTETHRTDSRRTNYW
jgi:hypothetical protein